MKTVIRTLFVWLLLCAIPLQGYAMARMACVAAPGQPAAVQAADHRASTGHLHHQDPAAHAAHAVHAASSSSSGHAHDDGADHTGSPQHAKCGSVGGCCIAFALPPSDPPAIAASNTVTSAVPFLDRFVPDIVPATLERPPRTALS